MKKFQSRAKTRATSRMKEKEEKKNRIDMSEETKMLLLLSMLVNPSNAAVWLEK